MKTFSKVLALCALAVMTGCATAPIERGSASAVPQDRVLARGVLTEKPGSARVTVSRDSGFMGSACTYRLFIDGQAVALLRGSERFEFFVTPGEHILSTRTDGICSGGTAEVATQVAAGQAKRFRISSSPEGSYAIVPTAF